MREMPNQRRRREMIAFGSKIHVQSSTTCPFIFDNLCAFPDYCPFLHTRSADNGESVSAGGADTTCCVCREDILKMPDPEDRLFGLLDSCSHVVCWSCVKSRRAEVGTGCPFDGGAYWIYNQDMDTFFCCPLCRRLNGVPLPSCRFMKSDERKILKRFQAARKKVFGSALTAQLWNVCF